MPRFVAFAIIAFATIAHADGQKAFDAALQKEAGGDFAGAAADLEKIAREMPEDPFADDALFEAALVAEEKLHDPARAAKLYAEVADRWPQSRLARRARARAEFLQKSLRTGEGPLTEYQRIVGEAVKDSEPAIARMEKLLTEHPDFALADRGLYWLGSRLAERGRRDEAAARFAELERRFPSSEWAPRAKKARADLLLRSGRLDQARALYQELSRASDPVARASGDEGLEAVATARLRRALFIAALIYFSLFVAVLLVRMRGPRALLPVPLEILYYIPVATLFVVAAATENVSIGVATALIAVGGLLVLWLMVAETRRTVEKAAPGWLGRGLRAAMTALAVVALFFAAVQGVQLTDLIVETFRTGPER